ncbi:hypothetical protein ABT121_13180 [Streptomyces sp. NPDC001928]
MAGTVRGPEHDPELVVRTYVRLHRALCFEVPQDCLQSVGEFHVVHWGS